MAAGEFFTTKRILPKSFLYNAEMKTLASSLKYAAHDPQQFRLHVLKHGKRYGVKVAVEAFGISRRTYFVWQKKLIDSNGKLVSLVPQSTHPKRVRQMTVDPRLLELIRSLRQQYGRIGKEKLAVLVKAYASELGIAGYGPTKIGKIIKRHNYFFEGKKRHYRSKASRARIKRSPKGALPGYLELDSIHVWFEGRKLIFITVIDVATRVAYAKRVRGASSLQAKKTLQEFQTQHPAPLHTVQTDNGAEFLGNFNDYLEQSGIKHLFSYPRSPRINGFVERFNRTLKEEFISRCDYWSFDLVKADQKLTSYLQWYNAKRPHQALNYQSPLVYQEQQL